MHWVFCSGNAKITMAVYQLFPLGKALLLPGRKENRKKIYISIVFLKQSKLSASVRV